MRGFCCGKLQENGNVLLIFAVLLVSAGYVIMANAISPAQDVTFYGNSTANFDNDGNFSVNWSAVSGAGIYYIYNSTNGGANGTNAANTSLTGYSVIGAANGQNFTFIIQAVNATNSSDTANVTSGWIYIDTLPPGIMIQSPANRTYSASVWFNATLSETNPSWVGYSLDGAANITMSNASGVWNALNSSMVAGQHSVIFYSNDSARNTNVSGAAYFTVDLTNPDVQIILPQNTTYNSISRALNYTANDTNLASVWYLYNGINTTLSGNTSFTALDNRQSNITLYANDSAGNINSTVVVFTVDTVAPAVSLNSPQDGAWNSLGKLNFTFTAEDRTSGPGNCSLWLNTTGTWRLNMTNTSVINSTSSTFGFDSGSNTLSNGTYIWNVQCYDNASNPAFASKNYTFTIGSAPDFIVVSMAVSNSSNALHPDRPIPGGNITLNATVMNNGSAGFSGNLTVWLYWDNAVVNATNITGLSAGTPINLTYNILSSLASVGVHSAMLALDPYGAVQETNESNNGLTIKVLTVLNVTILGITPPNPAPSQSLLVNISISYQDGDPATNISWQNITQILDYYLPGAKATPVSNSSAFITAGSAAGNYWFNITASSRNATTLRADAGNHTLFMFVADNSSGRYYNNSWATNGAVNSTSKTYELQAPGLEVQFDPGITYSIDFASATSKSFNIRIKNNGTANISKINITISSNSTSLTISKSAVNHSAGISCNYTEALSPLTGSSFLTVPDCSLAFNTTVVGSYILRIIAGGIDANNTQYNSTLVSQEVTVTNSTTASAASSSSSGSSSATEIYTYLLNISYYNSSLVMEQGSNATLFFTVKNTGNGTVRNISFSMSLPVGVIWNGWYAAPPMISKLVAGESMRVPANISVPANATISKYNITAKFMSVEPGASKTAAFLLNVLPGTTEKKSINISLADLADKIAELNATLFSFSSGSSNENLTVAKNKLLKAIELLHEAEASISRGDYLSVYDTRAEIEALISSARAIIEPAKADTEKEAKRNSQILVVLAVIVAIGAVIYYLMLPEEGYNPKTGYRFKAPETPFIAYLMGIANGARKSLKSGPKETIENLSEKSIRSKLLAKPQPAFSYAPKEKGIGGKLKKISSNLKDQIKEYKKGDKKPVYNFQKKSTWASPS